MFIVKPGHVLCPVCDGSKVSPSIAPKACLCCKGEGQLTVERSECLERIRADLGRRLLEAGYVSWQ